MHRSTKAIHGKGYEKSVYGELSVPIFQTSSFFFPSVEAGAARFAGDDPGYIYSRLNNPTVNALEELVAFLESGTHAMATATGMAAVTTALLTLVNREAHVIATDALYGASRIAIETELARFGVQSTFVDSSDLDNIRRAVRPNTRLIYVETPTNPTMKITDLRGAADIAHQHGALFVVDNTFASPYLQRPLELGADAVVESLTKFINGHTDVIGGMIVTRDSDLHKNIRRMLTTFGGTMDPHQAWLILRGARTLPLRMEKAQQNAARLAEFLSGHSKVVWVRYPGLPAHPQHDLAGKQMDGYGAMICFGVKDGLQGGLTLMNHVRLVTLAVSLGGLESLIEHPASMTHASVPREEREQAGILDELVRLCVGCGGLRGLPGRSRSGSERDPLTSCGSSLFCRQTGTK